MIHGNPVANGWAGAVMQKSLAIQKKLATKLVNCGRVGRGIQPRSTPQPPPHTQTCTKSIQNARFQLNHFGRNDGSKNQRTDGRAEGQSLL